MIPRIPEQTNYIYRPYHAILYYSFLFDMAQLINLK